MFWLKLKFDEINNQISKSLDENTNYNSEKIFGIPGSWLNDRVFPRIDFLNEAPFLRSMVENPNHIGCHTIGKSEKFFKGTHKIERDVLRICAEELLNAKPGTYDGYLASGGTEGNIQALWVYRNYYNSIKKISNDKIKVISSKDCHYSVHKACNLLGLENIVIDVDIQNRQMKTEDLIGKIEMAKANGTEAIITVLSMGTTMFASVDSPDLLIPILKKFQLELSIHIDAAFGGFIYPLSGLNKLNFDRPEIGSFSLDGHKMLQSPYGTGVFLIRKPFIENVSNEKASYVMGLDQTLCGSRSGALAVAMWMILYTFGSKDWGIFINGLLEKTDLLGKGLKKAGIEYFREPGMNLITIKAQDIDNELMNEYHWVSDNEEEPQYFKAVIMEHVKTNYIEEFLHKVT